MSRMGELFFNLLLIMLEPLYTPLLFASQKEGFVIRLAGLNLNLPIYILHCIQPLEHLEFFSRDNILYVCIKLYMH